MKIQLPKVSNMCSDRSGNKVPNQFIIKSNDTCVFQSYETIIAAKVKNQVYIDPYVLSEKRSKTTLKYLNQFLGTDSVREVEKNIKSGEYKVLKLNN